MLKNVIAMFLCLSAMAGVISDVAAAKSVTSSRSSAPAAKSTHRARCARGSHRRSCRQQPKRKTVVLARVAAASRHGKKPRSGSGPSSTTSEPASPGTVSSSSTASASPAPSSQPAGAGSSSSTSGSAAGSGRSGGSGPVSAGGSGSGSTGSSGPVSGGGSGSGSTGGSGPVSAGGSGSPSGDVSAPVPAHVQTWAYDDCGNGGTGAGAGLVQAWVSYAESNCGPGGDGKALSDCHSGGRVFCDVVAYLDTNWIYPGSSPMWGSFSAASSADWFQHSPGSSAQISTGDFGGGYLIDQAQAGVRSFFASYAQSNYDGVDGLMMDDQSAGLSAQLYSSSCGCSADSEFGSDAALQAAHSAMSAAMTHANGQPFTQIDNTLPPNPYLPQGLNLLDQSTGVTGLVAEGEPEDDGTLDPDYSTLLDQIAYVAHTSHAFVVPLSYAQAGASDQAQSRRVQEATMLLGYNPGHLVDWADLEQGSSDLAVWPEEGIYPTKPVQSMSAPGGSGCLTGSGQVCATGGHNSLQVAPGVYRREFGACYDQSVAFGACAAIVNTTASPVTIRSSWLSSTYSHQVTLTGGDVQSGGTINTTTTTFTPNTTTINPHDATILAR